MSAPSYDEDIVENPFLIALQSKHKRLYASITAHKYTVRCAQIRHFLSSLVQTFLSTNLTPHADSSPTRWLVQCWEHEHR